MRLLVVTVAAEPCVILPWAVILVSPLGLTTLPARKTGASDVMLTKPCVRPEKSMPMGLSAFTELVMVSVAESKYW